MDKRGQKNTFVKSCSLTLIVPLLIKTLIKEQKKKIKDKKNKKKTIHYKLELNNETFIKKSKKKNSKL